MTGLNLGAMYATLGIDVSQMEMATMAMRRFERISQSTVATVAKDLEKSGQHFRNFGFAASLAAAPIALIGRNAFNASKDFESAMQKIVGLVGISQEQVNQWSSQLLTLGPILGRTPLELANALYFVTSSGFASAEALDIVTQSAKAASAGLGDTRDIADLVTSAMSAYSSTGLTAAKSLDILTAAVRLGKGEASAFAKELGEVIPIAARLGVGFDQVAGASAAMTLTGSNVAETATYLRQILVSIQDATPQAKRALKEMGTTADELRRVLKEQGLLSALKQLDDLTKQYGESLIGQVFGNIRALTGHLSLMGDRYAQNLILQQQVTNSLGDMEKAYQVASNTMTFKYNQAIAQGQSASIAFGRALNTILIPIFQKIISVLQVVVDWFNNLSSVHKNFIIYVGLAAVAIGPLAIALGALKTVIGGVTIAVGYLRGAVVMLNAAFIKSPLGVFLYALSAVAAALIPYIINLTNANNVHKQLNTTIQSTTNLNIQKIKQETETVYGLFETLKRLNSGTLVRKELINKINTDYSQYLPKLLTEKTTLEEVNTIEAELIKNMQSRLALQMQGSQITKILTDQMNRNNKELEKQAQFTDKAPLSSWIIAYQDFVKVGGDAYTTMDKNQQAMIKASNGTVAYISKSKELTALSQITGLSIKYLSDIFSKLRTEQNKDEQAIKNLTEQYSPYIQQIKNITGTSKGLAEQYKEIDEIMKDVRTKEEQIQLVSSVLGKTYDASSEKLRVYNDAIERLAVLGKNAIPQMRELANLINKIKTPTTVTNTVNYKTIIPEGVIGGNRQMEAQKDLNKTLENQRNTITKLLTPQEELQKSLAEIAMRTEAMNGGMSAGQTILETYQNQLQFLKKALDEATPGSENFKQLSKQIEILQNQLTVLEQFRKYMDDIASSTLNGAKTWKEFGQTVLDVTRNVISAMIAEAIATAITNAIISTAKAAGKTANPFLLLAIPAFVGLAVGAANTAINRIPRMAEGGVVPPGYSNDTYPAMLTSGEVVTPPNKLGNIQGGQEIKITIEGKTKGDELRYLLKEVERRYNNAY